jgi:hypothetical protein
LAGYNAVVTMVGYGPTGEPVEVTVSEWKVTRRKAERAVRRCRRSWEKLAARHGLRDVRISDEVAPA